MQSGLLSLLLVVLVKMLINVNFSSKDSAYEGFYLSLKYQLDLYLSLVFHPHLLTTPVFRM